MKSDRGESVYSRLGFEAHDLLFDFLERAHGDAGSVVDVMACDLNERDIVAAIESFGPRLRAIVDDSSGHRASDSAENRSADRFAAAGAAVKRTHFHNLQHNKVFITRRGGEPESVLCGSINFTYRGLYIQANDRLVFHSAGVARRFGAMFDLAFTNPGKFGDDDFAKTLHVVHSDGKPTIQLCFSPPAVDQATSSVIYSVAFLG